MTGDFCAAPPTPTDEIDGGDTETLDGSDSDDFAMVGHVAHVDPSR